jgi:CubicO group peptidase (beta-lactamase class C family)
LSRLPILLSAAVLCGFVSFPSSPPSRTATADLITDLDSLVTRRAAEDSFSGVVLVARKGEIVYQRAVGVADRERRIPMSVGTKLQIASTTKLFTQIAIRQLEQLGRLALADTVGKFLPDYPNKTVRSKVTIDQLLRHRSGVGSFWNERFMARHASVRSVRDYMELFQDDSLLFEPGTSEAYSNGGYVLLGAIIERVSGQSYHDYVRSHVFVPAGMTETAPYDSRVPATSSAVGYTFQSLGGPLVGDRRLAGAGSRQARQAVAQRAASGATRRPNTAFQAGVSGPAGDHYSTVGDFLRLARALTSHRLLDSTRTAAVLGQRYATGGDFRANGGGPGVNAEFSIFPSGDVMVVLSNYDPPSATTIAQFIRSRLAAIQSAAANAIRSEVDSLHAAMVAAFKRDPASVARFYADDARIIGMGMRRTGREEVDQYWSQGMRATDWILETVDAGGTRDGPWVLGRSTIVGTGGRRMVTDYMAVLARGTDGRLRYRIDLFTAAQ